MRRWGNCIWYAFWEYRAERKAWRKAGRPPGMEPRLIVRPSRMAPDWIPTCSLGLPTDETGRHFDQRKFAPDDTRPLRWWQVWRALWFRGHVQQGDSTTPHDKG
jgi:hypothetical protein